MQFLYYIGTINNAQILCLGVLLFFTIFSYTSVMDRYSWSMTLEWSRLGLTAIVIITNVVTLPSLMYWTWLSYLLLAILGVAILQFKEAKKPIMFND